MSSAAVLSKGHDPDFIPYISTDPNAGQETGKLKYLSTDPNAGTYKPDPDFIPYQAAQPIADSTSIGAAPSAGSRAWGAIEDVGRNAVNGDFPYLHPFNAASSAIGHVENLTNPIENYTQEGRATHPALSRIGDITSGAKDLTSIVWPEISALTGAAELPEKIPAIGDALNTLRNGAAEMFRKPYSGSLKPWVPKVPFAKWATEAVVPRGEEGTITNPLVLRKDEPIPQDKFYKMTSVRKGGAQPSADLPRIVNPTADRGPVRTGSEGRPATWTNQDVDRLARSGNRDAITQLGERGKELPPNTRYVMGDLDYPRVIYNPRDVTRFTPEGTPIRVVRTRIPVVDR